jgi:pSer/pThr/pTyr-binding forkhead associated (FHA) protein
MDTGDKSVSRSRACLVVGGRIRAIEASCEIGRTHPDCPSEECRAKGFLHAPDIQINDAQCYVSRHHLKVECDGAGECWVTDLQSLNGSAIFHVHQPDRITQPLSSSYVEKLTPLARYRLSDGDLIALAYHEPGRPFFVITYHESGLWVENPSS